MRHTILILFLVSLIGVNAQEEWQVSDEVAERISQFRFDEDFTLQGQGLYDNYCASCHGVPSESNFVLMIPSPGDPAEDRFQIQKDGTLFHKIKVGRGGMPAFDDVLGEDELWALVAYMRSFNKAYEQPEFKLEGVHVPELTMKTSFDDNVDKLVVRVLADGQAAEQIKITAFVKGFFGNLKLGEELSNEKGLAFFNVDTKMPGDTIGNLNFIVKAQQDYAYGKTNSVMKVATPKTKASIIDGRHLWSTNKNAPLWLKGSFYAVVFGIWAILIVIVIGLLRLKRIK